MVACERESEREMVGRALAAPHHMGKGEGVMGRLDYDSGPTGLTRRLEVSLEGWQGTER